MIALACATYLLRGTKEKEKFCGLRKIDKPNSSIGGRNEGSEYEEPRVPSVRDDRYDVMC